MSHRASWRREGSSSTGTGRPGRVLPRRLEGRSDAGPRHLRRRRGCGCGPRAATGDAAQTASGIPRELIGLLTPLTVDGGPFRARSSSARGTPPTSRTWSGPEARPAQERPQAQAAQRLVRPSRLTRCSVGSNCLPRQYAAPRERSPRAERTTRHAGPSSRCLSLRPAARHAGRRDRRDPHSSRHRASWPTAVERAAERLGRHATGRRGRDELCKTTGVVSALDSEDWEALVCFAPYAIDATVWRVPVSLAEEGTFVGGASQLGPAQEMEVFEPGLRRSRRRRGRGAAETGS